MDIFFFANSIALCYTKFSISLLIGQEKSERIAFKFSSPIASNFLVLCYHLDYLFTISLYNF